MGEQAGEGERLAARQRAESGSFFAARDADGQLAPPSPPDRGYAWLVVLACFACNALVDGFCFSYGVLREHIASSFVDASPSLLSVAGSCLTGSYLLAGPVSSALANTFGCRPVVIVGAVLATASFFAASYVKNIYAFVCIFGLMGGVSFGLVYLPATVTVGFWFEQRRAFATGVAVCGSGIGTAVFSLVIELLISRYSWRGALMILAAVMLNCALAGSLLMPLERYYEILTLREKRRQAKGRPLVKGHIIEKLIENKKRERNISQGSLNGWIITNNNKVEPPPPDFDDRPMLSTEAIHRIAENVLRRKTTGARRLTSRNSFVAEGQSRSGLPQLVRDYAHSQTSLTTAGAPGTPLHPHTAVNSEQQTPVQSNYASRTSLNPWAEGDLVNEEVREAISKSVLREMLRPMNRQDVFHSGSLHHIVEYTRSRASVAGTRDYYRSVTSVPHDAGRRAEPAKSAFQQMLDLSILQSPTFLLLLFTSVLTMLGFLQFYQFIKAYAVANGVSDAKATSLVSLIGVTNTIGRIVSGIFIHRQYSWASDRSWADCLWINNLALIGSGVATAAIPFCRTYVAMVICSCLYGLFISAWVSLRTILLVELLGLEKLTNAFGLLLLFQGFGIIVGPPLGSAIDSLDFGSNYSLSFYLSGCLLLASGLLGAPLRMLSRWEARRAPRRERQSSQNSAGRPSIVVSAPQVGEDAVDADSAPLEMPPPLEQPPTYHDQHPKHEASPDEMEMESRI